MAQVSRRDVLHTLCGCAVCYPSGDVLSKQLSINLKPVVTTGYAPLEQDERGLWQSCEQLEEQLSSSNMLIKDEQINVYLQGVLSRLLGDQAKTLRIFPMRNPAFNASMFPNGMMIVHSGLLARMRNEAQLAAVLGHESGHYLRRHSLQGWRDQRAKTAGMAFVAAAGSVAGGFTGVNFYDLAFAINQGLLLAVYSYSRELESEADAYGLKLLTDAGYPPEAASAVWAQIIEERKASAAARNKKYKDGAVSSYSTHPPSSERMTDLATTADNIRRSITGTTQYDDRRGEFLAAVGPYRAPLIEEQVKLNDPGASLYLVNSLAQDGWDSVLRFYEGEVYRLRDTPGDMDRAAAAYKEAVAFPDAGADAYRAHGYAQLKKGSRDEGIAALKRYLELKPDANDAPMVRFTLEQ